MFSDVEDVVVRAVFNAKSGVVQGVAGASHLFRRIGCLLPVNYGMCGLFR
jgi:hypothetical protein